MKGVLFLGLVGAAIYGAILLSYHTFPRDPAGEAFTGRSLGDAGNRLRSWGTDLPDLASSSSQEASLPLPAATAVSPSRVISSTNSQYDGTAYQPVEWGQGRLCREGAQRRLCFFSNTALLSAWYRITGREPAKRLGSSHRSQFWRARLGVRAISCAGRRSDCHANRNSDSGHDFAGPGQSRAKCKEARQGA
jgi:hypothetical protein